MKSINPSFLSLNTELRTNSNFMTMAKCQLTSQGPIGYEEKGSDETIGKKNVLFQLICIKYKCFISLTFF